MNNQLQNIKRSISRGEYIQSLFDPIQTHAIYGVDQTLVAKRKEMLKENGATRFRIVRPFAKDLRIICFKLNTK